MAGPPPKSNGVTRTPSTSSVTEPVWVKWTLIALVWLVVGVLLVLPMINVFGQALSKGLGYYCKSISSPDSWAAIKLTLLMAAVAVPLNVVFGVAAAWAVTRFEFRGKALLITLIDLPFSVSPVVVGLMLMLLFGRQGLLGPWLDEHDVQVVFAAPGLILATVFVTFAFVARELIPIMQAAGSEQEQAALTLGASGWQTFWHVTLPNIKWGLVYGVVLCNARAMGEYGAVAVVSGSITGRTDTIPLRVEKLYSGYDSAGAFALASLLALLALVTLGVKSWLEWKNRDEH